MIKVNEAQICAKCQRSAVEAKCRFCDEELCWRCADSHSHSSSSAIATVTASPDEVVAEEDCPDCRKATAHAYSDSTTPGFYYTKCEKHRLQHP